MVFFHRCPLTHLFPKSVGKPFLWPWCTVRSSILWKRQAHHLPRATLGLALPHLPASPTSFSCLRESVLWSRSSHFPFPLSSLCFSLFWSTFPWGVVVSAFHSSTFPWGWKGGSAVTSMYSLCRRPDIGSKYPRQLQVSNTSGLHGRLYSWAHVFAPV